MAGIVDAGHQARWARSHNFTDPAERCPQPDQPQQETPQ